MSLNGASARRNGKSAPRARMSMSFVLDGTIRHVAGPARTSSARFLASSVTVCFLPAMVHLPSNSETVTSGAPHCSRPNGRSDGCANTDAHDTEIRKEQTLAFIG